MAEFSLFAANGMVRCEESDSDYGVIKRCLLEGMGLEGSNDVVMNVVVHKDLNSIVDGDAKAGVFETFLQVVETKRGGGNANVQNAWYGGGGRSEVFDIIHYGFGISGLHHCNGVGVHLSPANAAIFSALRAEKDEYGFRHMLLCRVILGNTETIPFGSKQSQPSSLNFDSGIDNPQDPRKYIIWTPYMNSHILPLFIISFKGPMTGNSATRQIAPRIYLPLLVSMISRYLEPSKMDSVRKYCDDFMENKIQIYQLSEGLSPLLGGDRVLLSLLILSTDHFVN